MRATNWPFFTLVLKSAYRAFMLPVTCLPACTVNDGIQITSRSDGALNIPAINANGDILPRRTIRNVNESGGDGDDKQCLPLVSFLVLGAMSLTTRVASCSILFAVPVATPSSLHVKNPNNRTLLPANIGADRTEAAREWSECAKSLSLGDGAHFFINGASRGYRCSNLDPRRHAAFQTREGHLASVLPDGEEVSVRKSTKSLRTVSMFLE